MKNLKYIKLCIFTILLLTCGVLLGSYITEQRIEKKEGSAFNTTKLAIVNLDEGINYEGEYRNFAKELINSQKKDVVLTGLDDAKSGMQDGRYSGYLIMPSDFSANTITVNGEPQKSLIKYEINGNLSDEAKNKAIVNVSEITKSLNDDLGYVYLYSLFNSVHEGQNNAIKVISNDSKDKEVLMAISNIDLVESLNLTEVERMENNIENLDVVEDFEKNQELINAVDIAYKGYLSATSEELANVKVDSNEVKEKLIQLGVDITNIPTIEDNGYVLSEVETVVNNHNTSLLGSKIKLNDEVTNKKTDSDSKLSSAKSTINNFLVSIDMYNEKIADFDKFGDIKTSVDEVSTALTLDKLPSLNNQLSPLIKESQNKPLQEVLDNYIVERLLNYYGTYTKKEDALQQMFIDGSNDDNIQETIKKYSDLNPDLNINTLSDYFHASFDSDNSMTVYPDEPTIKIDILNALQTDIGELTEPITEKLDKLNNEFPETVKTDAVKTDLSVFNLYVLDVSKIQTHIGSIEESSKDKMNEAINKDLKPLKEEQSNHKTSLLQIANNDIQNMNTFNDRLAIFDPLAFIDEREVEGFIKNYQKNTSSVENKINGKDREYKAFVDDSYRQADEHIGIIREDINKYQKSSDEKLSKGLENAQSSRTATSGDNQKMMKNFINTLPYSRLGENANTSVYQFMVEPTIAEDSLSTPVNRNNNGLDYNLIYISILGACIIVFGILYLYTYISKKKLIEE